MAEQSQEAVASVVADVVAAPSLEELARRCVGGLQGLMMSTAVSFDLVEPDTGTGRTVAAIGVSDYFLARYEQHGRCRDPVLERAISSCDVVDNRSLMSPSRWMSLPIYQHVFHLHKLTNILYAPVISNGTVVATIDVGRGDRGGRFADREVGMMHSFASAVGAAYGSMVERGQLIRSREQLAAALDASDEALIVTDANGGQRHRNRAAKQLLARLAGDAPALDDLLARAKDGNGGLVAETRVTLAGGEEAILRSRSSPMQSQPGVVVSVLRLEEPGGGLPAVIESSLTGRECDAARLAILGLRDTEIADRMGISPHTVKHYLKSTYRKLGVRSRVELANLAR
jgi:DNA-binding CsgD family transcriptional regulator/GAF domain-containing protein